MVKPQKGHSGASLASGSIDDMVGPTFLNVGLFPSETRRAAFDLAVTMKELGDSAHTVPE